MKKLVLILVAIGLATSSMAQGLLIKYDFLKDDFTFYETRPGKPNVLISKPVVDRNHTVKLEVVNFNKFVYGANCTFESGESGDNSKVNFFNLLTPLVVPQSGASFLSQFGAPDDENSRGGSKFNDKLADKTYLSAQTSYQSLYEVERTLKNIDFSIRKLQELKYNRYLPADSIKNMACMMVTKAIRSTGTSHGDFLNSIEQLSSTYRQSLSAFKLSSSEFEAAYNRLSTSRGESLGPNTLKKLEEEVDQMDDYFNEDFISNRINLLENMFESIANTEYKFNASELAENDFIKMEINVFEYPLNEQGLPAAVGLNQLEELNKVKTKKLKITVKGDLKINSSLGLAFPYYQNNFTYINVEGIIKEQSGNNFAPNLAAFMNFYPYNGKLGQLGGTFGLGVPVNGDDRNINILMGGSSLFGSDNRIVINAGATLGQVNKLDQGLKTGDMLENEYVDVPVIKSWQWGAFVGISFSIAKVVE